MGLQRPTTGEVRVGGKPLAYSSGRCEAYRRRVQMVLQDAAGSLNPRQTVYESVAEGIRLHRLAARRRPAARPTWSPQALSEAGLRPPERLFLRYPHELSGGQQQRVLIAGALACGPSWSWPTSRSPAWTPRSAARSSRCCCSCGGARLGVVVITHDLGLAWNIADRIAVMYLGRVVECGTTEEVLAASAAPLHPGAALGRARDGPARAGRAHRRDPGPDAGSRPAAGSTRAARRWPTGRPRSGVADGCRGPPRGAPRHRRPPRSLPPRRRSDAGFEAGAGAPILTDRLR